ncbi:GNAT family N-acetyltransferase [Pelagibacterium montanilacus]|uniref:GNAT family N-acetyltransferase n=1 Tax=Pelagibacterium montanilacus TaxID=2185280 RepID=UPI000F8F1F3C|nr:GNAT family N-acetyltransferase [Pelagibacterium montanilacus]
MVSIEPLQKADLPETARLHEKYLKLGLFPRLGKSFLARYQESFALSPYGIALVARSPEGKVLGALFGTTSNARHYAWVVRNCGWRLALWGGVSMSLRPRLALSFLRTRVGRYSRALGRYLLPQSGAVGAAGAPSGAAPSVSVLSHIVTGSAARRQGIGRELVESFKAQARRQGVDRVTLVTEEGGLGAPFFERIGCLCVGRRAGQDGSTVREYRLMLKEARVHEGRGNRRTIRLGSGAFTSPLAASRTLQSARAGEHR